MDRYKEFTEKMEMNYLDKHVAMDVLNLLANGNDFINNLIKIKNKETKRGATIRIIYSEDYEKDDNGYFGENSVLFYAGDENYDILDYDDMYLYLYFTCEFYIEKNPEEKVDEIFKDLEEIYININININIK